MHEDWEVEVVFRVNGRGRIGADGLVCILLPKPCVLLCLCDALVTSVISWGTKAKVAYLCLSMLLILINVLAN